MKIQTKRLSCRPSYMLKKTPKLGVFAGMVLAVATLFCPFSTLAAIITYTPSNAGSFTRFDYTVTAQVGETINEFTIYFRTSDYKTLGVATSPIDWQSIVVQPDTGIPADGFFDSANTGAGIIAGQTQANFSALFQYIGTGIPGNQRFDIVDPTTFATISSGITVPFGAKPPLPSPPSTEVPEPSTISLFGLALALLYLRRRYA